MRHAPAPSRRRALGLIAAAGLAPTALASRARAADVADWGAVVDAARAMERMRALVIVHHGEVAVAEALNGPSVDRPVNVKSVSKTLVAAILGAAIDRGVVPGVQATLAEVAPGLRPRGADPRVDALTMDDLVTMRAGLERTSGANYGGWVSSRNWVADALSRPFVAEPGGPMLYSTGSFHVLGAALARASGRSLLDMTRDWVGAPLGVEIPAWTRDPQGFYLGGNEMALSPLAMARFGEMYRLGGALDGRRVLTGDWVQASLQARARSPFSGLDYGYGWFLGRSRGGLTALARGYGGQVIAVAPEAALTVAITSDPTQPARSAGYFGELLRFVDMAAGQASA